PGDRPTLVVAAERWPELLAIHPSLSPDPWIVAPVSRASRGWTRLSAITELMRSRLTICGPVSAAALAGLFGITEREADEGLLALESEGVVLRGAFTARSTRTADVMAGLPAGIWERAVLPARLDRYEPAMLDMLCLSGDIGWARLTPPGVMKMTPVTPVALFLQGHAAPWQALRAPDDGAIEPLLTSDARI